MTTKKKAVIRAIPMDQMENPVGAKLDEPKHVPVPEPKTEPDKFTTQTIKIPGDVYLRMRDYVGRQRLYSREQVSRVSAQSVIIDALREFLDRNAPLQG